MVFSFVAHRDKILEKKEAEINSASFNISFDLVILIA